MWQHQKSTRTALASLAITLGVIGAGTSPARAQDATSPCGTQFFVTPYLWLPGINATIKTGLARQPEVNADVSAIDLLSHLDGVPLLVAAEIRQGPMGLLGDVLHMPVSANITTRNIDFSGGTAKLTANTGTAILVYRVLDTPSQFGDLGGGMRAWGFSANLTLNGAAQPTTSASRSAGWGDPLLAGRYHYEFGNGFGLTAYGDLGGFGVGAHSDWQLIGTVDYAPTPWLNLRLGYRSLNFNYQGSGSNLGFDVHMKGPILAGTFRF
jgi:hypothetical protein